MTKILVADDDNDVRATIVEMLGRGGYDVSEASDGEEMLELYKDEGADVVITDILMPAKQGLRAILELREENPSLPVIAISGGGFAPPEDYLRWAESAGATRTLSKPITRDALFTAIVEAIEESASE